MKQRCKCIACGEPLMAFQGYYLHPEMPCSGLQDYLYIEAINEDEFLHEKFEKLYGKPEMNDYERIGLLEEENNRMSKQLLSLQKQISDFEFRFSHPLVKFLIKLFRINPPL